MEEKLKESFRQKTWSEQTTKDSWMVFKIMGEIVSGYEKMQKLGPCVSLFLVRQDSLKIAHIIY